MERSTISMTAFQGLFHCLHHPFSGNIGGWVILISLIVECTYLTFLRCGEATPIVCGVHRERSSQCIHPFRSCLPPFYDIPIFPLLNRKIFHLLFCMHTAFNCLRLFVVVYCLYIVLLELCYVYIQLSLLQLLLWASYRHFDSF